MNDIDKALLRFFESVSSLLKTELLTAVVPKYHLFNSVGRIRRAYRPTAALTSTCPQTELNDHPSSLGVTYCLTLVF